MASMAAHHAEWLSLLDVSGPFLSVPVLKETLPNGLDAHDPHVAAEVRAALEQWADLDSVGLGSADEVEVHLALVRFVLHDVLGFDDDVLRWDADTTSTWTREVPQVGVLTPDAVVVDGDDAAMLVSVVGPGVRVDEFIAEIGTITAQERMVEHLKATGLRVGLVTDGERWTLVSFQEGENPGFATWWSSLWGEEKITLQAFRTLLHQDRFVSMGADETIASLLERSAEDQREVTTKLGNQTLDAVEILIRTIDRIDHERGGALLAEVPVEELYDAAVTVMMRLIFLFYAEENDLLPVAEPLYNDRYAASTLRERLQAAADEHGEEVLESTHDGWPRLLATWRAVFGGVEHADMVLAPYGGSLFDPDRYPFLEGRQPHTSWTTDAADPLPIDNRTVLHLLNALQTLDEGGQRRKLSFRALDVEQIGHVYEGMLDHTAARADGWVLGLSGTGGREPEIELDLLESLDDKALLDFLKERTGRSPATLKKWVSDDEADKAVTKFGITWAAALTDADLEAPARRFAKLIRPDSTGAPTVFQPGSVYVADSSHRGATGTHYTPRSLTEEIVKHTLDPLVYTGPADGIPEDEWELRTPEEILDLKICDPACGSGAFLVQACRYLADAVVEANRTHQRRSDPITEDEIIDARRQVAERCLHGVDINPMACEMAKLSLWLITLAHDRPFTFLDHAIRNGDSLLGVSHLEQVIHLHIDPARGRQLHSGTLFDIGDVVRDRLQRAARLLSEISATPSRAVEDLQHKSQINDSAAESLDQVRAIADSMIEVHLQAADEREFDARMLDVAAPLAASIETRGRRPSLAGAFHWPLEFPAVFVGRPQPGFDAFVANPPFLGGKRVSGVFGTAYRRHLVAAIGRGVRGSADLVAYFFLRCAELANAGGSLGLLATNTIAQGDTREVGLDQLVEDGWSINRAVKSTPWPGDASLEVAKIWMSRTALHQPILNDLPAPGITPSLNAISRVEGAPRSLIANKDRSFIGTFVLGMGFVIDPSEAAALLDRDARNRDVLFPYLTGQDLNNSPTQEASRWVINFFDMSIEQAESYRDCFQIVERLVKPERQRLDDNGDFKLRRPLPQKWWIYADKRPKLYEQLGGLERTLALTMVSKLVLPAWVSSRQVIAHKCAVFPYDTDAHFALLSSEVHRLWVVRHSSSLGGLGNVNYSPSDCFETLAQPDLTSDLAAAGADLHRQRAELLVEREIGLTQLYNLVHDPTVVDTEIDEVRNHHLRVDTAVAEAYGWGDIDLAHGFHASDTGTRFSMGPEASAEVIDRLLELNFRCYIEEFEAGLHGGGGIPELTADGDGTIRLLES